MGLHGIGLPSILAQWTVTLFFLACATNGAWVGAGAWAGAQTSFDVAPFFVRR